MADMANMITDAGKTVVDVLNRLAGWLLFIAIIWLCWGIARVVWLVLAPPQAPNLPLAELQAKQAPAINTSTALTIFENNVPKPVQTNVPPPNIELAGVMVAIPSSLSSAMLVIDGQMANYRVNEPLEDTGYTLVDVAWNEVVIENASHQQIVIDMPELIALDQGEMNAETAAGDIRNRRLPVANRRPDVGARLANRGNSQGSNRASNRDPSQAQASTNQVDPATALDTAVSELKQNPASYLSRMGVMATGEGYQVTNAMPAELRQRLGLENGDKVLSLNGHNVGSNPASDADVLNQVKQSGQATIEVQRGDQIITVRQQF